MLQQYKSASEFTRSFQVNDDGWKFFEGMAITDTIDVKAISEKDKIYLTQVLKASIARQLWRNEGYFEVENTTDNTVKKALEILRK